MLVLTNNILTVNYINHQGGTRLSSFLWERFGKAQVDLFANAKSTHYQLQIYHTKPGGLQGQEALTHN